MSMGEVFGYFRCSTAKYSKPQQRGLTFFYFMVYRHFLSKFNVGIRNKNKNKIQLMSDYICSQCAYIYQARKSLLWRIVKN